MPQSCQCAGINIEPFHHLVQSSSLAFDAAKFGLVHLTPLFQSTSQMTHISVPAIDFDQ
jgi:hypothetical protein